MVIETTTSLSLGDLEEMQAAPPPPTERLARRVTSTSMMTVSAKNFVTRRLGTISDDYEMGAQLGAGGFGEVFLCKHKSTGMERAVKIIPRSKWADESDDAAVIKEFDILKELDHPNILKQVEMMIDDTNYYIVTEICRGGELFDEIQEWGNFTEEDAAEVIRTLLGAINYCHKLNIVHRDLKPENILLEEGKELAEIKVIDFGLAKILEKDEFLHDMAGSIYYIAPEVLEGSHSLKCDIWSVGVIAYVLLGGYAPFDGHSESDIKEEILSGEFDFDDEVWEDVSDLCKDFIATLLEYDPKVRPTAEEALKHPFMEQDRIAFAERLKLRESVTMRASEALRNLELFDAQSKLKQATCAFIASQLVLKEEKKKIDELFRALDIQNNGRLAKDDVRTGYKTVFGKDLEQKKLDEMFKRVDYDNTGYIEYSEFVIATMNEKDLLSNDKLKHAFNIFDADGSGYISKDELVGVLTYFETVDRDLDSDAINRIVQQVDGDDDGLIDYEEFTAMMFKTAEEAVEEESQRSQDDPVHLEATPPAAGSPSSAPAATEGLSKEEKSQELAESSDHSTGKPKQKNLVSAISGSVAAAGKEAHSLVQRVASSAANVERTVSSAAANVERTVSNAVGKSVSGAKKGPKACLALFESTIQKNKQRSIEAAHMLLPKKVEEKIEVPIARLSKRLSQGRANKRLSKVPTPEGISSGSSHVPVPKLDRSKISIGSGTAKLVQARPDMFQKIAEKKETLNGDGSESTDAAQEGQASTES